jgi:hypothetical protein
MRNTTPTSRDEPISTAVSEAASRVLAPDERLKIENTGCWATMQEDAIHVFGSDGGELYAVSSKVIPYESKPLFLTLQIYMIGHSNGRTNAQTEMKAKLEKFAELLKFL